jgi:hypothetical protein
MTIQEKGAIVKQFEQPLSCDMTAIPAEQRAGHEALVERLWSTAIQETQELPDGYAYRFAAEDYPLLTAFIANERLCCPFFDFVLEVAPVDGPIWLRITGPEGVKDILAPLIHS